MVLELNLLLLQLLFLSPGLILDDLVDDYWLITSFLSSRYTQAYLFGIVPRTPWDPRVVRRVDVSRELTE